jgi:invasion protein IalB
MSKIRCTRLALGAVSLLAAALATAAPAEDGKVYKDWRVKCEVVPTGEEKKEVCHILQNVMVKDSDQVMLSIGVGTPPGAEQPVALLTVPLGVFLPAGVAIKVGEEGPAARGMFQACIQGGCRALVPLDKDMITAMKGGSQAAVLMQDGARRTVGVPVSLSGFTAGFNAVNP